MLSRYGVLGHLSRLVSLANFRVQVIREAETYEIQDSDTPNSYK